MRGHAKRGLLVWGVVLLCSGLGVFAYGQISLLKRSKQTAIHKRTVPCQPPASVPAGHSVTRSAPHLDTDPGHHTMSGRSSLDDTRLHGAPPHGAVSPGRSVGGLDADARNRVHPRARSGLARHHHSRRIVMPSKKVYLSRSFKAWLRRQAKRGLPRGWLYVITGYATERSSRGKNLRLAKARAEAVRRYLVTRLGVPAHRIRVHRSVRLHKKGSVVSRRGVRVCVGRGEECR